MLDLFLGRTGSLRYGWRAFFFYVTASVGYGLLLWLGHSFAVVPWEAWPLGLFAVLVLTSWLFTALEARPLASLGLHLGPAWALDFGKGLLVGLAVILASALVLGAAGGFHLARTPQGGAGALAMGALVYLVPALNEELAFRGYILQRLERSLGTWPCLAAMSLLFAAAHLGNPGMAGTTRIIAFANISLAGVLLGLAYLRTRSLALPMGLHLGWNWAQGALLGFGVSGTTARGLFLPVLHQRPLWLTGGAFGLEGGLPCTFICLLACLLMGWRWPHHEGKIR